MGKLHIFKTHDELLETVRELETQLEEYRKLQSEVYEDIKKVWMYDSSLEPLTDKENLDSKALIYKVFYKIANQWID